MTSISDEDVWDFVEGGVWAGSADLKTLELELVAEEILFGVSGGELLGGEFLVAVVGKGVREAAGTGRGAEGEVRQEATTG